MERRRRRRRGVFFLWIENDCEDDVWGCGEIAWDKERCLGGGLFVVYVGLGGGGEGEVRGKARRCTGDN